jgi:hypothetical protein
MTLAQVHVITPVEVRQELSQFLQLGEAPAQATLIASAVRRLCSFMCPCPSFAIQRMALRSLKVLGFPEDELHRLVENALEDLSVSGDVLELSRVTMAGAENFPSWLYCAPPSFIARATGRIYITGIAADDASFLPREFRANLTRDGAARFIESASQEITEQLKQLGLRQVKEAAWMSGVRAETVSDHLRRATSRLRSFGVAGDLPDLTILEHAGRVRKSYSSRWKKTDIESGAYIGRVPQPYGAPLWYLCDLVDGKTAKSILLPTKESTERASDVAWRIQFALDSQAGFPATYSVTRDSNVATLSFDFPVPLAVRRRFMFLGARRSQDDPNPFRFQLPLQELEGERRLLRDNYWLEERTEERTE